MSNHEYTQIGFANRDFLAFSCNLYCHPEDFDNTGHIIDSLCAE